MSAKLLLIEDDFTLAAGLEYLLKGEGFDVDLAHDAVVGLDFAMKNDYDTIICDRMLPGMDGLDILKHLRNEGRVTKFLFLTAKDTIGDRVEGLDAGAEDYISKPFSSQELLARIRVLLRRPSDNAQITNLKFGDLEIQVGDNRLHLIEDTATDPGPCALTPKESQLIQLFFRNPEKVLDRKFILEQVWGTANYIEENNIDICVHYLRQKMSNMGSTVAIRTVRGVGYIIERVSKT